MRPLAELSAEIARGLDGVVFDLDGTVLSDGRLGLDAYRALFRLRQAGLHLVACTGRPAGWGRVIARQWPIDTAITENGAIAFAREGDQLVCLDGLSPSQRSVRHARLQQIVQHLRAEFPTVPLADDNPARLTDVTFDVGECVTIAPEVRAQIHRAAAEHDARTFESSIHLHVTLECDDKASGTVRVLHQRFGCDVSRALVRYAFVGDSGNDEACFSAFAHTFGVANIKPYLPLLSVGPRYLCDEEAGAGFAAIADMLLARRRDE